MCKSDCWVSLSDRPRVCLDMECCLLKANIIEDTPELGLVVLDEPLDCLLCDQPDCRICPEQILCGRS